MVSRKKLEGLVGEFGYWGNHYQILKQEPWSSNQRLELGQKIFNNPATLPAGMQRLQSAHALAGENPDILDSYINAYLKVSGKQINDYVSGNLQDILKGTKAEKLMPCALLLNKEYQGMIETLRREDTNKMHGYVSEKLFDNKKELVSAFNYHIAKNPSILQKVYTDEIEVQKNIMILGLSDIEDKKPVLNSDKVRKYIGKGLKTADEHAKENAYLMIASAYLDKR